MKFTFLSFLDKIDCLAAVDYVPSIDDVLHCRVQTTGVVNFEFSMNGMNIRYEYDKKIQD